MATELWSATSKEEEKVKSENWAHTANLAGCKEMSLWSQVVNKNIELDFARVQEVIKTLYQLPSRETEKAKMEDKSEWESGIPHDNANLARYKEVSLRSQVVNKNIELDFACVQALIKIIYEVPSRENEKDKMEDKSEWESGIPRDNANLARCKEVSLLTQVVNKSTALTDTHVQELFEILGKSPGRESGSRTMVIRK